MYIVFNQFLEFGNTALSSVGPGKEACCGLSVPKTIEKKLAFFLAVFHAGIFGAHNVSRTSSFPTPQVDFSGPGARRRPAWGGRVLRIIHDVSRFFYLPYLLNIVGLR